MKKTILALMMVSAAILFSGCNKTIPAPEPTQPPTVIERVSMVVTEDSIHELEQNYPGLKEADLTGSTCYAEIEGYISRNPQVDVQYTVSLGQIQVQPDVTALNLSPNDYEFLKLRSNLQYLHQLQSLTFDSTRLLPGTIQELQQAYPNIRIAYTVDFCGSSYDGGISSLDVSSLTPEDVVGEAEKLALFPALTQLQLMKADGTSNFSLEQAAELQKHIPDTLLLYSFNLFGKDVSTTDEELSYANQYIGNKEGAEETLRMALTILRGCKRMVLDNCHFSNETLAQIRDDFRDTTKIVWRVWFGDGGCLTDREVIRFVYGLYDYNCENLIYCEDVEFIDFGHNELLRRCDYVAGMKNLRAIILSGSMVSDMTPFTNCKKLEFLELAFCGYVTDISPLAQCPNLKRLNIAFTKVEDLSPLDGLKMDVLVDAKSKVSLEEQQRFDAMHPECTIQHTGDAKDDQPYGYPWRYEPDGNPNPYYALLKEKFNYPNPSNTLW